MPKSKSPFDNLKKGSFKNYLKSTDKVPAKYRNNTKAAAEYIVKNKDKGFNKTTVRRARFVKNFSK